MNATNERQPTCAERVAAAAESRLEDLRAMLDPCAEDLTIETMPHFLPKGVEQSESDSGLYQVLLLDYEAALIRRDELAEIIETLDADSAWTDGADNPAVGPPESWHENDRAAVLQMIFDDYADEIREAGREAFSEYGLAFDYVEPGTFSDLEEGYFRYQISFGGPSEEIRFFASRGHDGWHLYRAEFWYLDWFDGAPQIVTDDERALAVWSEFIETETVEHVFNQAMEA